MKGLTWLHISDWHQKGEDQDPSEEFDRTVMRDALLKDIQMRTTISPNLAEIDFIVFSGDVASSGHPEDYQAAIEQLFDPLKDASGVYHDRIFIIPGNHDMDKSALKGLPFELREPLRSEALVKDWLLNEQKRMLLMEPFQAYSSFVKAFTGQQRPDYASICKWKINDKKVVLLGLNSAWMCGRHKDENGKFYDRGFAVLGEPQLHDQLGQISDADLKIAVLHHPFDWIADFDLNCIERTLRSKFDFILCGHTHKPRVDASSSTYGNAIIIPAGSSYHQRIEEDQHYVSSYNFVHLDYDNKKGVVFLRRWNEIRKEWVEDINSCNNGRFDFLLLPTIKQDAQEPGANYRYDVIRGLAASNNAIDLLLKGIALVRPDYSIRIKNFFAEYLGSNERPVPFGGRNTEMDELTKWLDNPKASPYLLLVAQAGMGKSSLLVRWCRHILDRRDVEVIFIPISIRFRTNLSSFIFGSLASRLAFLHGADAPNLNSSTEILFGLTAEYLTRPLPNGHSLLVIIDAIDEAADLMLGPDIFPSIPPKDLRLVVSGRYLAGDRNENTWLHRLGWEQHGLAKSLVLSPLTEEGISDVLKQMGFPLDKLGKRVDLIFELHRLSEGDPLLVRLYVEDIWSRGDEAVRLDPEDLVSIEPGLDGYFDRWWDDQRKLWGEKIPEPAVRELLNIFSCAVGPLSREDVIVLSSPEIIPDSFTLDFALTPLSRLIIGDGINRHYVFSHPRLSTYFYNKLTKRERQYYGSRFIEWGQKTLAELSSSILSPEYASPYIVQYYCSHIIREDYDFSHLLSLVCGSWLKAREALEGAYSGFLNDVGMAWNAIAEADQNLVKKGMLPIYLGKEVRCALCYSSIINLSANIKPDLLTKLVESKIWTLDQGLAYAKQIPTPTDRIKSLEKLSLLVQFPQRANILREAMSSIIEFEVDSERENAILDIVYLLETMKEVNIAGETIAAVRWIKSEKARAKVLLRIAFSLPESKKKELINAAELLYEDIGKVIDGVAPTLSLVDKTFDAGKIPLEISKIVDKWGASKKTSKEIISVSEIINIIIEANQKKEIESNRITSRVISDNVIDISELLNALENAKQIRDEYKRVKLLTTLAQHVPNNEKTDILVDALTIANNIKNKDVKSEMIADIASLLPETEKAIAVAKKIDNIWMRDKALANIALGLSNLEDGIEVARCIRSELEKSELFANMVYRLPETEKALALISEISFDWVRDEALANIALNAPKFEDSLKAANEIKSDLERVTTLIKISQASNDVSEKQNILIGACSIARKLNRIDRVRLLANIAYYLDDPQKDSIIEEIQKIIRKIPQRERAMVFTDILPHQKEPQRTNIIKEALAACSYIDDPRVKARVLSDISQYLTEPQKTLTMERAIGETRRIWDEEERMTAILALIPKVTNIKDVLILSNEFGKDKRIKLLISIYSHFSDNRMLDTIKEIPAIARKNDNDTQRAKVLKDLKHHLRELEPSLRYSILCEILHNLARRPREDTLLELNELIPIIISLGGTNSMKDVASAVLDTGKWWP